MKTPNDVSPAFHGNRMDSDIASKLLNMENNVSSAVKYFRNNQQYLSNYAYWFILSVMWVKDAEAAELECWKRLFRSDRPDRIRCIMKPSEIEALKQLPDLITAYRAHRPGETDWISYTTDIDVARKFAGRHKTDGIVEYQIRKHDVFAFFTRRQESEILLMDKGKATWVQQIMILDTAENTGGRT